MRDFIAEQNVDHYLSMLQKPQLASDQRTTLQKLLVEEENLLGRNREQLELADRRVHEGKQRIRKLKQTVANWHADERAREPNLSLVTAMEKTQELLEDFHRTLRNELYPYCIMLQTSVVGVSVNFEEARRRAQQFADANPQGVVTIIDRSNGDSHVVKPQS